MSETARTRADAGRLSPLVLASLVASNLIPLVGVGWFGWSPVEVLLLYWIESGIVGLFNVPRILLAQGPTGPPGAERPPTLWKRLSLAGFFCLHYGGFWAGHFFLIVLVFRDQPLSTGPPDDGTAFFASVGAMLLSHAVAFFFGYVGKRAYRTASPDTQMWLPYVRVVTLHVGAFVGAALLERFDAPVWGLVGLVALKTLGDAVLYVVGHGSGADSSRVALRAGTGGPGGGTGAGW